MRQVFLDIETTGMNKLGVHYEGHRIVEIGAVEMINRRLTGRYYHVYLKPDRSIDPEAFKIHGISNEFLADKPSFSEIANELINFIHDSELIIHNAPFDIGFMDYELDMLNVNINKIETFCNVIDSLCLAKKTFPGKRNNLDALCDRYLIDKSKRILHSALVDAEILAKVFLCMTGGQTSMYFIMEQEQEQFQVEKTRYVQHMKNVRSSLKIIYAKKEEIIAHEQCLDLIQKQGGRCLWKLKISSKSK